MVSNRKTRIKQMGSGLYFRRFCFDKFGPHVHYNIILPPSQSYYSHTLTWNLDFNYTTYDVLTY